MAPAHRSVVLAVAWVALLAALFQPPTAADTQLDPSWQLALNWFFDRGLQFGRDVVFTFGPLGFLTFPIYSGSHLWMLLAGQLLVAGLFAAIVAATARTLPSTLAALLGLTMLVVGAASRDALFAAALYLTGLFLFRARPRRTSTVAALISLLAAFALVKFTLLLLAATAVVLLAASAAAQKQYARALATAGWFAVSFLTGWMLLGQAVRNLPAYLSSSWSIARGYEYAMADEAAAGIVGLGGTVLGLLGVSLVVRGWTRRAARNDVARVAFTAAFVYLAWKHGFTRADPSHTFGFFVSALVVVASSSVQLPRLVRRTDTGVLALAAALSVVALARHDFRVIRDPVDDVANRFERFASVLLHGRSLQRSFEAQHAAARAGRSLDVAGRIIGESTVDVLGHNQAIALLSGLNYHPRPAFQGYGVYNAHLARLNEQFYLSDDAPDYTLVRLQTIDGRLAALDDARVLRVPFGRYEYVLTEGDHELWRKRQAPEPAPALEHVRSLQVGLAERVSIKDLDGDHVWATIRLAPTTLGQLRQLLLPPPRIMLTVMDSSGRRSSFRMPPPAAAGGFVVSPLLRDTLDYIDFTGGRGGTAVHEFRLDVDASVLPSWRSSVSVDLHRFRPVPIAGSAKARHLALTGASFKVQPASAESAYPASEVDIDGRRALMLHAPSTMIFDVPGDATRVSGRFGILPAAYQGGHETDGATFSVACDSVERTVLFEKHLAPLGRPGDRPLHAFNVAVPCPGGRLRFTITPGPAGNAAWDWTVWAGIAIR